MLSGMLERNSINCVILAAGFGTRLGEIGETTPKGLLSVSGHTLIDKLCHELVDHFKPGSISLITNDLFNKNYVDWQTRSNLSQIKIINNHIQTPSKRLGAIGDIIYSLDQLSWWKSDLLVVPSDTFYNFSLESLLEFYYLEPNFTTVFRETSTDEIQNRLGCGVIRKEQVSSFVEKPEQPPSNYAAVPFYIYPQPVLMMLKQYQQEGMSLDAPGSIIPWLLTKHVSVRAFVTDQITIDVGTKSDLNRWVGTVKRQHT